MSLEKDIKDASLVDSVMFLRAVNRLTDANRILTAALEKYADTDLWWLHTEKARTRKYFAIQKLGYKRGFELAAHALAQAREAMEE